MPKSFGTGMGKGLEINAVLNSKQGSCRYTSSRRVKVEKQMGGGKILERRRELGQIKDLLTGLKDTD